MSDTNQHADSNLSVFVAFVITIAATVYVLYISGAFHF